MSVDENLLRYFNQDIGVTKQVELVKNLMTLMSRIKSQNIDILVLGAGKDSVGKEAKKALEAFDSVVSVTNTDVSFPTYSGPMHNGLLPIERSDKLDTTQKFSASKRSYHLVLGRAIVCLCGTNLTGGPCGFPDADTGHAAKFLRRVGKSLAPNGVAYLHGDAHGMKEKAKLYWDAARAVCQGYGGKGTTDKAEDWFTVDLIGNPFVGIKITKGKAQ